MIGKGISTAFFTCFIYSLVDYIYKDNPEYTPTQITDKGLVIILLIGLSQIFGYFIALASSLTHSNRALITLLISAMILEFGLFLTLASFFN